MKFTTKKGFTLEISPYTLAVVLLTIGYLASRFLE